MRSVRPRISMGSSHLTVVNPLRTKRIALTEITAVEPGYMGLEIRTRDNSRIDAWAVQQMNISTWLKLKTHASRVTAQILQRADEASR